MKIKHVILAVALVALVAGCFATTTMAQDYNRANVKPMFVTVPAHELSNEVPTVTLQTFSVTYPGKYPSVPAVFVGTDPRRSDPKGDNVTTTIPSFIIPIVVTIGSDTFDPTAAIGGGKSAINQTIAGPIFQKSQWTQGGTNLGNTQYHDAYIKGSYWQAKPLSKYHLLFGQPTVTSSVSISCGGNECSTGSNPFGGGYTIGFVDINLVDATITSAVQGNSAITPASIPIGFLYNIYMTSGGQCCIGGYHSRIGAGQAYSVTTYMSSGNNTVVFSEDDGALSHELGEFYADPFVDNRACGGLLEVGDPLETDPNPAYGLYTIPLGGYTYHIQDLVFFSYFWQTPSKAVNGWYTFQNSSNWITGVCNRGQ